MALGYSTQAGAVMAPADVRGAGQLEWSELTGVDATHPLLGGGPRIPGLGPHDADRATSYVVRTLPVGQSDGMGPGGDAPDAFDDWRDLFDFRNSPAPWVLLMALAMIGFVQFRVQARGGPARVGASLG